MLKFNSNKNLIDQIVREKRDNYWHNAPLQVSDKFALSIQGSEYHYSSPRKNLPSNKDYHSFEVAILMQSNGVGDKWNIVQPRKYFSSFDWSNLFEEGDTGVASYLEINLIEDLIKDIQRVNHIIWIQ